MRRDNLTADWQLYQQGLSYQSSIGYKSECDKNERFYAGDQWYGVKANNLPTPVFNIFKRITDYIVSYILSSPLKISYQSDSEDLSDILTRNASLRWEKEKMDMKLRRLLLDAALTGDMAVHVYWDTDTAQGTGDFKTECVDGVNVFFGNVNESEVQKQPYIIIAGRTMTANLKREAFLHGKSRFECEKIVPDSENENQMGDRAKLENGGKTTFLIKYYKDANGRVRFNKSTRSVVIREEVDTGLNLYPVAFGNYTKRKNSFHGRALGTGLIPNQIFINKIFAMAMKHLMDTAFPKAVYDKTRVANWNNAVGSAIGVTGDITNVAKYLEPAGMGAGVITLIDRAIEYTQQSLGATDVLLGQNVNPDNTSAIVALQKTSAVPLDDVKQNLYTLCEDIARIWLCFIKNKYSLLGKIPVESEKGCEYVSISPEMFSGEELGVKINVGPSSYWSEITSVQTLDKLLSEGHIDLLSYLKRLPDGYIPAKNELIREIALKQSTTPAF